MVLARAFSKDLTNDQRLRTAQGEEITIRIDNGRVYANGAKVIDSDFITNNGVVHVLDGYRCHARVSNGRRRAGLDLVSTVKVKSSLNYMLR